MKVLVPEGFRRGGLPDDVEFVEEGAEFAVPTSSEEAERLSGHPGLRVVQVLAAGVDWVEPHVPDGVTLCNAGDIAHHFVISVETPRKQFVYDTDGAIGVASRLRVFDMLAASRTAFIAYHFPWPGLGYLGPRGDGYRYFAAPLRMVL